MARPCKEGLDYFPHDVDSANDEKIETLCAVYGHHEGYSTYYRLLERIYRAGGKLNISVTEIRQKLARNCGHMTDDQFQKFLNTCCNIELFDKSQYEQGFITSNGIQKRIAPVILKRHRAKELYEKSVTETTQKPLISVTENPPETTQSKEKKKTNIFADEFNALWNLYPSKDGKKASEKHFNATVKNKEDLIEIQQALNNYLNHLKINSWKKPKNGSTWFNNWRDWVNWQEPEKPSGNREFVGGNR